MALDNFRFSMMTAPRFCTIWKDYFINLLKFILMCFDDLDELVLDPGGVIDGLVSIDLRPSYKQKKIF